MSIQLPHISTYGEYSSQNYGANSMFVEVGPLAVWYSYRTPVAFRVRGHERVIRENDWGPTTGKHLNWIDPDKSIRVSSEVFEQKWSEQVEPLLRDEDEPQRSEPSPFALGIAGAV